MPSVEQAIGATYQAVISMTDMHDVSEELRHIAAEAGLGVAILVAWQHGLRIGHIPLTVGDTPAGTPGPQVRTIAAGDGCPYVFVNVPVRQFRRDKAELMRRGIMNSNADPARFIYHEDGLVGTFSFQNPRSAGLADGDIREILGILTRQGLLVPANVGSRQVQFKDLVAKKRIEESGEKVYVRVENRPPNGSMRLPAHLDSEPVRCYVADALRSRSTCNYCSVQALNPHEATVYSAYLGAHAGRPDDDLATVRNYQLGFTFSPVGDPRAMCHFLAWDFPRASDLVLTTEPQAYSFSDLVRLVRVINRDIGRFCREVNADPEPVPISGACNHWAGNSIYHQHYQFFRTAAFPLAAAPVVTRPLVTDAGVEVCRFAAPWPSPAMLISSSRPGRDEDVMRVADSVAREWAALNDGEDHSYSNGIAIKNHSQNSFVTVSGDRLAAIFIPRHRGKLSTSGPGNPLQKSNAGVLDMMGYFVIDDPHDLDVLMDMSPSDRKKLGDSWLSELAPDAGTIAEFEDKLRRSSQNQ